jgi:hypothetical protein
LALVCGEGEHRARVDDDGALPQGPRGGRRAGVGRVDQRGAGAGEAAGGRVQVAGGGQRVAERVRGAARRRASGRALLIADQQPGVVGADRASAHQDRVHLRAEHVDLVKVGGPGQDQALA